MTHDDFETEPVPGLPAYLPEGEHIVWQGAPDTNAFRRHILHERKLAIYFALIAAWKFGTGLYDGETLIQSLTTVGTLMLGAAVVFLIIRWYARAIHRSTIYTITNKRVVMRFGVALPVTFNFPFAQINNADVKFAEAEKGTITLGLKEHTKISWVILWPHVRPWKLAQPQPAIRMIDDLETVSKTLATQLHAFHEMENIGPSTPQKQSSKSRQSTEVIGGLTEQGA